MYNYSSSYKYNFNKLRWSFTGALIIIFILFPNANVLPIRYNTVIKPRQSKHGCNSDANPKRNFVECASHVQRLRVSSESKNISHK